METVHIELYLLGALGILIHYLKDFEQAKKAGKKYSISQYVPTILLSTVTTMVLVYLREDIKDLYVITKFSALILGYFGNSVFFSFVSAKSPSGANKGGEDVTIHEVTALPIIGAIGEWYHISGNEYFYYDGTKWMSIVGGRPNDRP